MWATRANGAWHRNLGPPDAGEDVAVLVDLGLQARFPQYALDNRRDTALPVSHRGLRRQPCQDVQCLLLALEHRCHLCGIAIVG